MKLQHLIRLFPLAIALAAFAPALTSPSQAQTLIGPGVVPAPVIVDWNASRIARIVAGTEIIATSSSFFPNTMVLGGGGGVSLVYGPKLIVDEATIAGASLVDQPGVTEYRAGSAIGIGGTGRATIEIFDGVFRGGSISLATFFSNTQPGSAVRGTGGDQFCDLIIHDGLFEGGTVTLASAPDTILSRAPALYLGSEYGGNATIYGGTFVGGIETTNFPTDIRIHGSSFTINPRPADGFMRATFTVSGNYGDGSPFATLFKINGNTPMFINQGPGYLDITEVPEPAAAALAWGLAAIGAFRRRASAARKRV